MSDLRLVREIRQVTGGFIVEARYPYGNEMPYGEVICKDLKEVFALIEKCAIKER
jgi:hypothetical protein